MAMREPSTGELNRRITVRLRSDKPARDYGLDSVFTDEKRRWASIVSVGAAVYSASVQLDAKVTHRITLRFLEGVTDDCEVVHGSALYRVRRVGDLNGTHRFTVLEVELLGLVKAGGSVYG
ncbi:phage head closure protein [Pseudomonas aegrilactucae]|uniref:Phage head closure protein n=1 Tax=Pseudomonas aegrilactucae TaxID=2854028 RepID=A0A9Q2XIH2_9PSED|nr:phage head closure protein [Pseudomonas aegrilactucae]MBV6287361.1 phage head closure protein [Pseudomonas aegrilactucae]